MYLFPLKHTAPIDFLTIFRKYLTEKHGQDALNIFLPKLEELQKLRNRFDFLKLQQSIVSDYKNGEDMEKSLIQYLQLMHFLDRTFYRAMAEPNSTLVLNFIWGDSFYPNLNALGMSNIKYEIVNCLYNLALVYYTTASVLSSSSTEELSLKAVAQLRNALWCIQEIKQICKDGILVMTVTPSDLNIDYLAMLEHYILGHAFTVFSQLLIEKPAPVRAQVHLSATNEFKQTANALISPNIVPGIVYSSLKTLVDYSVIYNKSQAYHCVIQHHLTINDDELLKGHMGIALSYSQDIKTDIDEFITKNSSFGALSQESKDELGRIAVSINQSFRYCFEQNTMVYKQETFTPDKLPSLEYENKTAITPIEPKQLKQLLDDESKFEIYSRPELLAMQKEFQLFLSSLMTEIVNTNKAFTMEKDRRFTECNMQYLLGVYKYQQKILTETPQDPGSLTSKIKLFQEKGGLVYIENTKNFVKSCSQEILNDVKLMQAQLELEEKRDSEGRQNFGENWVYRPSKGINRVFYTKINNLDRLLVDAAPSDKRIKDKFEYMYDEVMEYSQRAAWVTLTTSDPLLPEDLYLALMDLEKLVRRMEALFSSKDFEEKWNIFMEQFAKSDLNRSFAKILDNKVDKVEEFMNICSSLNEQIAHRNMQVSEAKQLLEQICGLGKTIVIPPPSSRQIPNQYELGIKLNRAQQLLLDLTIAKEFYEAVRRLSDKLKQDIEQFCRLRENNLLNISTKLDPQNNKKLSCGNPYQVLEESMRIPPEVDYEQLGKDDMDIGAKWSSIKITQSMIIDKENPIYNGEENKNNNKLNSNTGYSVL
jgi:hypothetical protein